MKRRSGQRETGRERGVQTERERGRERGERESEREREKERKKKRESERLYLNACLSSNQDLPFCFHINYVSWLEYLAGILKKKVIISIVICIL